MAGLRIKPADRCCCSLVTRTPQGFFRECCGPPIWKAGRGIAVGWFAVSVSEATFNMLTLFVGDDTRCSRLVADSVSFLVIADAIVGAMVYGFGFYASSSMQSEMAMAFLVLHISFQCFNIPLSICATGLHSMSPRASDPELDQYCCDLESAAGEKRGKYGGECGNVYPSGINSYQGWFWGAVSVVIHAYFTFVIWSMYRRCKDGIANLAEEGVLMSQFEGPAQGYPAEAGRVVYAEPLEAGDPRVNMVAVTGVIVPPRQAAGDEPERGGAAAGGDGAPLGASASVPPSPPPPPYEALDGTRSEPAAAQPAAAAAAAAAAAVPLPVAEPVLASEHVVEHVHAVAEHVHAVASAGAVPAQEGHLVDLAGPSPIALVMGRAV